MESQLFCTSIEGETVPLEIPSYFSGWIPCSCGGRYQTKGGDCQLRLQDERLKTPIAQGYTSAACPAVRSTADVLLALTVSGSVLLDSWPPCLEGSRAEPPEYKVQVSRGA